MFFTNYLDLGTKENLKLERKLTGGTHYMNDLALCQGFEL